MPSTINFDNFVMERTLNLSIVENQSGLTTQIFRNAVTGVAARFLYRYQLLIGG